MKKVITPITHRIWWVKIGVWFVIFFGVVFQSVVLRIDFKALDADLDLSSWGFMKVGVALVGTVLVYRKISGKIKDELSLKRKAEHVGNVLFFAFMSGVGIVALLGKVI